MPFQNEKEQEFWQQCVLSCLRAGKDHGGACSYADYFLTKLRERYKPVPAYDGPADGKIAKIKYLRQIFPGLTLADAKGTLERYSWDLSAAQNYVTNNSKWY